MLATRCSKSDRPPAEGLRLTVLSMISKCKFTLHYTVNVASEFKGAHGNSLWVEVNCSYIEYSTNAV
jgi:hypothetical protein